MVVAKKWVLVKYFDGFPKESDLQLQEETLPELEDGDVLLEAVWLSVDPYMRYFSTRTLQEGDTMCGTQVALVKESRNPKYKVGSYVDANVGWRTHTVTSDESKLRKLIPLGNHSLTHALGALGMTGMTAYFGFLEICKPQPGETVLVTGAGGAVGSLVGQIAKLKGCKVIAFTGTEEKCRWLKEDLKFDVVHNYKNVDDTLKAIREAAPDGVDCFFDNTHGKFFTAGVRSMRQFGRIAVCGGISTYNAKGEALLGPFLNYEIVTYNLKIEGFVVYRWLPRWDDGIVEMMRWMDEGKIQTKETITEGFENMRSAFFGLFVGENIGKAVVKV